jgi:hypothetical protein
MNPAAGLAPACPITVQPRRFAAASADDMREMLTGFKAYNIAGHKRGFKQAMRDGLGTVED